MTAWMDPDTSQDENNQNSSTTYMGALSGDLSFDRVFLRGGNSNKQFDYGEIRFGTDWSSVLPMSGAVSGGAISVQAAKILSDRNFSLTFNGPAAQSYTIWATTNLTLPFQRRPISSPISSYISGLLFPLSTLNFRGRPKLTKNAPV